MTGRQWVTGLVAVCLVGCGSAVDPHAADADVPGCVMTSDCGAGHLCVEGQCEAVARTDPDNTSPGIVILAPANGDLFQVGVDVTLVATVNDDAAVEALTFQWHTNRGGVLGDATIDADGRATFVAEGLLPGDHTLTATVTDAGALWTQALLAITVDGRPSRPFVRIEPEEPSIADDLTVVIVHEALDENRGSHALNYRYRWFVDQVEREDLTGTTVPHTATIRGQSWTVRVSAADPFGYGAEAPASVVIGNAPPTCEGALLLPPAANTTTAFTCLCPARDDLDPDDLTLDTCTFHDGETLIAEVQGENGACVLGSDWTTRGMSISCALTPTDEFDPGEVVISAAVLVDNSFPTPPGAALVPDAGTVTDEFTCEMDTWSTDADGDSLSIEVAWFVNNYPNAGADSGPVKPGDLVRDGSGTPARGGAARRCEIRARDQVGQVSGPGISETLIIGNTAPTGGTCAVTPTEGVTAKSVLTCEGEGGHDIDADPISWTYAWTVTGPVLDTESTAGGLVEATSYPPVTGPKLSGMYFHRDALVSCVATPTDGAATGEPVDCGAPVLVANSMPTLWEVFLEPLSDLDCEFAGASGDAPCAGTIGLHEPVTCAYYGWSDPDEIDIVEVRYSWLRFDPTEISIEEEGADGIGPVMVPSEVGLVPGDTFTCIARPFNGPDEGDGVYATHVGLVVDTP